MENFKSVLVGLELSGGDSHLLKYLRLFNSVIHPKKVLFFNVHQEIRIPSPVLEAYPEIEEKINNVFIKDMVEKTENSHLSGCETEYEAIQGDVVTAIIKKSKEPEVELMLLGRKEHKSRRHLAYKKMARKADCSVLIVPEDSRSSFKKIHVAIDFSASSKNALETALHIASIAKGEVVCHHVYEVPTGYYKTGKSFTEFAQIMKANAKKDYQKFIEEIDTKGVKLQEVFTLSENGHYSESIEQISTEKRADLIVIGSKGHSLLGSLFIGSTAEALVDSNNNIPLLLVKHKGEFTKWWNDIQ